MYSKPSKLSKIITWSCDMTSWFVCKWWKWFRICFTFIGLIAILHKIIKTYISNQFLEIKKLKNALNPHPNRKQARFSYVIVIRSNLVSLRAIIIIICRQQLQLFQSHLARRPPWLRSGLRPPRHLYLLLQIQRRVINVNEPQNRRLTLQRKPGSPITNNRTIITNNKN